MSFAAWTNQKHHPDLYIWVVTRHQYGISAIVSQTSFRRETACSGGVATCRLLLNAKCNFIGTMESVCMLKKRLWLPGSWTSTGFVWKTNTSAVRFIVFEHQNGRRDGIWKHLYFSVLIVYLSFLAPWPHYYARLKRFGSRGPSEDVSFPPGREFPFRSPRIRHWRELSERDWENAVQGRGNSLRWFSSLRSSEKTTKNHSIMTLATRAIATLAVFWGWV